MKSIKTWYWVATIIFALFMLMDGYGGITQQEAGKEVFKHLGYPMYLLQLCGVAKIFGAIAILQNTFKTIKEWAYAGFSINFLGALASRVMVGDEIILLIPPVVALAIMFIPYLLWKKYDTVKKS
ncbi:MAG: DoxX family protein [Pedobacter sp.]|nr:MAG: DoxX family protein [Pedobacter sp.]